LVRLAQDRDWVVGIVATPSALPFLDVPDLEKLTGYPVRSRYRSPTQPRGGAFPPPDAIVVAPGTYNTICKLALGVSDTYALGVLAEAIGRGIPVVILPFVNAALAARRPFVAAVHGLRAEGVAVLLGSGVWLPHPPGTGEDKIQTFPWAAALDATADARPGSAEL